MFLSNKAKFDELFNLLNHHDINLQQYLIIYMVYYKELSAEAKNYLHRTGPLDYKLITDLVSKKLIAYPASIGQMFELEKANLTKKGLSIVAEQKTNYGLELWNHYPAYGEIKGEKAPLKTANKEALISEYNLMCIFHAPHAESFHQNVMSQLKYALNKDPKMLTMSIVKFVNSCQWELIEEFRKAAKQNSPKKPSYGQDEL